MSVSTNSPHRAVRSASLPAALSAMISAEPIRPPAAGQAAGLQPDCTLPGWVGPPPAALGIGPDRPLLSCFGERSVFARLPRRADRAAAGVDHAAGGALPAPIPGGAREG